MKDMVEKIRYAEFEPNQRSDSENIIFLKICFGQNFINKKLHFPHKPGLKIQVSIRFFMKFLLHRRDSVDRYNLVKEKCIVSTFCINKIFKFRKLKKYYKTKNMVIFWIMLK